MCAFGWCHKKCMVDKKNKNGAGIMMEVDLVDRSKMGLTGCTQNYGGQK